MAPRRSKIASASERASGTISVLLLEDHSVVREGLRLLLEREPDIEVCAEAGELRDALAADCEPDVVLSDLVLPDGRGAEAVAALRERFSNAQILILSMVDSPMDVHLALQAGARGYVVKDAVGRDLLDALRRVARGEDYIDPVLGAALARDLPITPRTPSVVQPLSRREEEVLRLLALGHTNAEAASILGLALRTIEAHRLHIPQKLGLRTRAELVHHAMEAGLIDTSPR